MIISNKKLQSIFYEHNSKIVQFSVNEFDEYLLAWSLTIQDIHQSILDCIPK